MALPPERISVKRRRQDEPVDTLILEPGAAHGKKKQFTDFYFQRLRRDDISVSSTSSHNQTAAPAAATGSTARDYSAFGIPLIRSTEPGDEARDFANYKRTQQSDASQENEAVANADGSKSSLLQRSYSPSLRQQQARPARRFHLTRDISSSLKPNPAGGIRRAKISLRPPLATFIELPGVQHHLDKSFHKQAPVDSLVELVDNKNVNPHDPKPLTEESIDHRTPVDTFVKAPSTAARSGHSIRDDPVTWDQDSDQLANELAALAFDIDPADATEPPLVEYTAPTATAPVNLSSPSKDDSMHVDGGDDFVFETYVRVKYDPTVHVSVLNHNNEVGVLVIDDDNEDLWDKYVHSDDEDDEWNDEDEDSNAEDNPRNEYPDDEVSTDDEFGRNSYRYRRNTSDDEQYDALREEW